MRWAWVADHTDDILDRLREHLELTLAALAIGLVLALPLGIVCYVWRRVYTPVLVVAGVLYTIPSLALLAMLVPFFGITKTPAIIMLVTYTMLILVRNAVAGLDAIPDDVLEAAEGMGYSRMGRLLRIELPLALPAIVAGIRITMVSTLGLVTIAALLGQGGLGQLIYDGLLRDFRTPLVVGTVLTVALAVIADLIILGAQRRLMPGARGVDER